MSQNAHLTTPDPEYDELFKIIPHYPPSKDVEVIRQIINNDFVGSIREHFRPHLPQETTYQVADYQVPHSDGSRTLVRTLVPRASGEAKEDYPCLVWVHGGGFSAGSVDFDDFRLRITCVKYRVSVALLEYRLGPENPFPISLNDCYDGLKWVADNCQLFHAKLATGFIIGGTSAGANMVATMVHRARDDPFFEGKRLTGQMLQIPPLVHPNAYPEKFKPELLSINVDEKYQEMTILTREMVYDMYDDTLRAPPEDPELSPLLFSHEGFPPTVIQVAGLDPLRDEGILYDRLLRDSGVKTKLFIYPGLPHGFHLSFPKLKSSQKFENDTEYALTWLLGGAN